jgi:hypothetical protein
MANQARTWHRNSGVVVDSNEMSLDEMLNAADLNWRVETSPFLYGENFEHHSGKSQIAYHGETGKSFGVVGPRRNMFQNRDVVRSFVNFCQNSGDDLKLHRLCQLDGGAVVVGVAKLKHQIDVLKKGDVIETYLTLKESHYNGCGLQVSVFYNRLVCTNGMTNLVKVKGRTITHGKAFNPNTVQAYLAAAYNSIHTYEETMNGLASVGISDTEAKMHLGKFFGDPSLEWDEQPQEVKTCYRLFAKDGLGSELMSSYQTLFGLTQAVSEYMNWMQRGSNTNRAFQSVLGGNRSTKINKFTEQLVGVHLR